MRLLTATVAVLALTAIGYPAEVLGKDWTTSGAEQLAAGKLEGISVLSTGEARLAPEAVEFTGLEADFVWDVEVAEDGTIYAAGGSPGALYKVSTDRVEVVHKTEDSQALCVLPLPDGTVLLGTAPGGVIYRINRRGVGEVLVDLEDNYVWDMARGPFGGIFCATGPNGRLLKLDRGGDVTELVKVKQKNLMCVAVDGEGTAYFGTDPDGFIYALPRDGKATVLFDADEGEIHDIVVDADGVLYACTAQGRPSRPNGPQPGGNGPRPTPPRPVTGQPQAPNSVYRLVPGSGAEQIAQIASTFLLGIALSEGDVLVGTGPEGRIVVVDRERQLLGVLAEFEAENVMSLAMTPDGGVVAATSKAGGIWRLSERVREEGTIFSKPFDSGFLSHWGRLWWREETATGQRIRLRLRTGNSGEPNEHWGEWSEWVSDPAGGAVDVPMGRFAQFAAELSTRPQTGTPSLLEVNVSYRQVNRRPVIQDVQIDGESLLTQQSSNGGPGGQRPQPSGPRPRRGQQPRTAEKQIAWKAVDPNGDQLAFDLYYRGLGQQEWLELQKDITGQPNYKWDTSRVPDGRYLLKLVARDDVDRPAEDALSQERVTQTVLVDNRAPRVEELEAKRQRDGSYELVGVCVDEHSRISAIEVSHGSGPWQPVSPDDGILDAGEETFSYVTDVLDPGEHVFAFAAADEADNLGSRQLVIVVEREQ